MGKNEENKPTHAWLLTWRLTHTGCSWKLKLDSWIFHQCVSVKPAILGPQRPNPRWGFQWMSTLRINKRKRKKSKSQAKRGVKDLKNNKTLSTTCHTTLCSIRIALSLSLSSECLCFLCLCSRMKQQLNNNHPAVFFFFFFLLRPSPSPGCEIRSEHRLSSRFHPPITLTRSRPGRYHPSLLSSLKGSEHFCCQTDGRGERFSVVQVRGKREKRWLRANIWKVIYLGRSVRLFCFQELERACLVLLFECGESRSIVI